LWRQELSRCQEQRSRFLTPAQFLPSHYLKLLYPPAAGIVYNRLRLLSLLLSLVLSKIRTSSVQPSQVPGPRNTRRKANSSSWWALIVIGVDDNMNVASTTLIVMDFWCWQQYKRCQHALIGADDNINVVSIPFTRFLIFVDTPSESAHFSSSGQREFDQLRWNHDLTGSACPADDNTTAFKAPWSRRVCQIDGPCKSSPPTLIRQAGTTSIEYPASGTGSMPWFAVDFLNSSPSAGLRRIFTDCSAASVEDSVPSPYVTVPTIVKICRLQYERRQRIKTTYVP